MYFGNHGTIVFIVAILSHSIHIKCTLLIIPLNPLSKYYQTTQLLENHLKNSLLLQNKARKVINYIVQLDQKGKDWDGKVEFRVHVFAKH